MTRGRKKTKLRILWRAGDPSEADSWGDWASRPKTKVLLSSSKRADVFIGFSQPGVIGPRDVRKMAKDAILFVMANPVPEIMPEEVQKYVQIIATGRSDYPNQINNVLCFPGLFRGGLDCNAREINHEMLFAAADAIVSTIQAEEFREYYVIPSVLDRKVAERVTHAVREAAIRNRVARVEQRY